MKLKRTISDVDCHNLEICCFVQENRDSQYQVNINVFFNYTLSL